MTATEGRRFAEFCRSGDPRALASVFDAVAPELLRVAWYLAAGDRHRVEDALQATFLTAIEDRARWDETRPLRPWLLGILANHVRNERRKAARMVSAGEQLESLPELRGADASEAAELRAAVGAALRGLPSPYREVVALQLEHGLDANEIAAALGRKPGTVRTQLVRGLEHLRRALPASLAGGAVLSMPSAAAAQAIVAGVRRALLSRWPHTSTPSPAESDAGTTVAQSTLTPRRLLVTISLVLTAALAWPWLVSERAAAPSVVSSDLRAESASGEAAAAETVERRELTRDVGLPAGVQDVAERFEVRVTVVDASGRKRAGEPVMLRLDDEMRYESSDAGGVVRFADLVPTAGFYSVALVGRHASDSGLITLGPRLREHELVIPDGMHLEVRVVDASGRPVAGAFVEGIAGTQWLRTYDPLGRTGADGVLRLRDLAAGNAQLHAYGAGRRLSEFVDVAGQVGELVKVELRLGAAGLALAGRVVDDDGAPLPGAEIAIVQFERRIPTPLYLHADREGRFRVDWLDGGRHVLVGVHRTRSRTLRGTLALDHPGDGVPAVELVLRRGARVTGKFTDAGGLPVPNATISARLVPEAVFELPFTQVSTLCDDTGSFVLDGVVPGLNALRASGHAHEYEQQLVLTAQRDNEWLPQAPAVEPIALRLVDPRGEPLAGWRVQVRNEFGFGGTATATDADGVAGGVFSLAADETRGFFVFAPLELGTGMRGDDHDAFATLVVPPLGPAREAHVIRVPDRARATARIRGRLLHEDGRVAAGARVVVSAPRMPSGYEVSVWTDADSGRFEIGPLSPGRYELRFRPEGARAFERAIAVDEPVVDLGDVRPAVQCDLAVRLVAAGDAPLDARGARVRVEDASGSVVAGRRTANGAFLARVERGPVRVVAWGEALAPEHARRELAGEADEVTLRMTPVSPLPVTVVLPGSQPRNQAGWSARLTVRDPATAAVLLETELSHGFRGRFTHRLPFTLPLGEGRYEVDVRAWDGARGRIEIAVPGVAPVEIVLER